MSKRLEAAYRNTTRWNEIKWKYLFCTMRDPAIFSPCRTHRYTLHREVDATALYSTSVVFVMLNPSTADETKLDPTIRRCVWFTRHWHHARVQIGNLWSYRDTSPASMKRDWNPFTDMDALQENQYFLDHLAHKAGVLIAAWGVHGAWHNRGHALLRHWARRGHRVHALGLTKDGHPRHPLYLPKTSFPRELDLSEIDDGKVSFLHDNPGT